MPINQNPGRIVGANVTPQTYGASGEWSLNQQFQAAGSGTWPLQPLAISRSLRFNSADTAYLSRTFSLGNRRTWTFSGWVKRSALGTEQFIFGNYNATLGGAAGIRFETDNTLTFYNFVSSYQVQRATTQVFRDVGAWYHIVAALDTTNANAADRAKLYVNGVQVTAFTASVNPTQNYDGVINYNDQHEIGAVFVSSAGSLFSGYLTEINFIDGQALTPSSFGFFDLNGIWQAKTYTGTYGTNGFYLNFSDNSGTTATTLGKDYSGNGNNWTPNNFSVAAGAGNDSLIDSPTNDLVNTDTGAGGEVRGNYATWNPLDRTAATYTNGNLEVSSTSAAAPYNMTTTIQFPTTGKWYCEVTATKGASNPGIGIGNNRPSDQFAMYRNTGAYITANISGIASSGTPATWTTGDVIGIAYDADAGTLSFYKNGSAQSGGFTSIPATGYCVAVRADSASGDGGTLNAGQRPFAYTAPSGYKALCSTNLPSPTILNGAQYFAASTYTGNGATQTINNGGNNNSLTTFQPDFVWIKVRSTTGSHALADVIRGSTIQLASNLTDAEITRADTITSFATNGFNLGANTTGYSVNLNSTTYVAWQWKAGGTAVTNTAGSITSSVSANTTAGFSIVTYTGNGTSGATVGHGLGAIPQMIIVKNRDASVSWAVYTATNGAGYNLYLNTTGAKDATTGTWNSTTPTSTLFTIGDAPYTNTSTQKYVAYCFAAVSGFSAFGSYVGTSNADGPFIYTGFRPRYILHKSSSGATSQWLVIDTSRNPYNVIGDSQLYPNLANAEGGGAWGNYMDVLSNGFKLRGFDNANFNYTGITYIWAAFAENPFKISRAR